jgi:hypothetical protein
MGGAPQPGQSLCPPASISGIATNSLSLAIYFLQNNKFFVKKLKK